MNNAVILLSGGQDSATCLHWALARYDRVDALTLDYGQRHAAEIDAAIKIGAVAASHRIIVMPSIQMLGESAMTSRSIPIQPDGGLDDQYAPGGLPTTFVPGRNLIFLAMAAAYAVNLGARAIIAGVCQTDYSGYPDCREEFILSMEAACTLAMPSSTPLEILTPLMHMTKAETVLLARELGAECWRALGQSVTCYEGRRPACGICPACLLRVAGFAEAGEVDPAHA